MHEHVSYDQIHKWSLQLAQQADADVWKPNLVVGITRGGLLPAQILSHHWHVPMHCHQVSLRDHAHTASAHWFAAHAMAGNKVFIVDDINDTGATIKQIHDELLHTMRWCLPGVDLSMHARFGVCIHKVTSTEQVDYHALEVPVDKSHVWWVFPWEKHA